jgi:hypothetical protein
MAALADALRADDEVPASFGAAGRAVYPSPDLDAELAALTYDSAAPSMALVRGDSGGSGGDAGSGEEPASLRALTYAGSRLTVHLEVGDGAVFGQVAPAQCCQVEIQCCEVEIQCSEVELQTGHGPPVVVNTDEDGWFVVRPTPAGRFRLHCRTAADGPGMVTGWIAV